MDVVALEGYDDADYAFPLSELQGSENSYRLHLDVINEMQHMRLRDLPEVTDRDMAQATSEAESANKAPLNTPNFPGHLSSMGASFSKRIHQDSSGHQESRPTHASPASASKKENVMSLLKLAFPSPEERLQVVADLLLHATSENDIEEILISLYPRYPLKTMSARIATMLNFEYRHAIVSPLVTQHIQKCADDPEEDRSATEHFHTPGPPRSRELFGPNPPSIATAEHQEHRDKESWSEKGNSSGSPGGEQDNDDHVVSRNSHSKNAEEAALHVSGNDDVEPALNSRDSPLDDDHNIDCMYWDPDSQPHLLSESKDNTERGDKGNDSKIGDLDLMQAVMWDHTEIKNAEYKGTMYWTLSETDSEIDPTDLKLDSRATPGHIHIHLDKVGNSFGVFILEKQPKLEDPKSWIWHDISSRYTPALLNKEPFVRHPLYPNIALKVDDKLSPRYVLAVGLKQSLAKTDSRKKVSAEKGA